MARWLPLAFFSSLTSLLVYPRTVNQYAIAASVFLTALSLGLALQPTVKAKESE